MVGMRLASMVLPPPGGPIIRMLCPPAQATSMARLAVCCPRTSLKSTPRCSPSPSNSDAAQAAVERQLADHHELVQLALVQRAIRPQNAEGHGQIEARSLLLHVRWSEIDRD